VDPSLQHDAQAELGQNTAATFDGDFPKIRIHRPWTDDEIRILCNAVLAQEMRNTVAQNVPPSPPQNARDPVSDVLYGPPSEDEEDGVADDEEHQHDGLPPGCPKWDWALVARQLPGRSRADCYRKWIYTLNPRIKRGPWSLEEDRMLEMLVRAHTSSNSATEGPAAEQRADGENGNNATPRKATHESPSWALIARCIGNGRTPVQCRMRWVTVLDGISDVKSAQARRTGHWQLDENERLNEGMRKYPRRWARIAREFVLTRNGRQCEHRWRAMHRIPKNNNPEQTTPQFTS
jgi:hypothetical protein